MTERNWAILQHLHFLDKPTFSAILVKKTDKSVTFISKPEHEDAAPATRKADWLLLDGLTEAEAKAAVAKLQHSLTICNQEIKHAKLTHNKRQAAVLSETLAAVTAE
jgi:hypothetical protein